MCQELKGVAVEEREGGEGCLLFPGVPLCVLIPPQAMQSQVSAGGPGQEEAAMAAPAHRGTGRIFCAQNPDILCPESHLHSLITDSLC